MRLIGLLLSVVTFFAYFMIAECIIRVYHYYISHVYGETNAEAFLHMYDSQRGWKNKPNAEAEFVVREERIKTNVRINSLGYRGEEIEHYKRPEFKRIVLLGDSMVAGFEVTQEETVSAQLQSLLNEVGSWEVINAGTRGYGTDQSFLALRDDVINLQPDLVIYFFVENDLENNIVIHVQGKKYGKSVLHYEDDGELTVSEAPVPMSFSAYQPTIMSHKSAQEYMDKIHAAEARHTLVDTSKKIRKYDWFQLTKSFLGRHSYVYRTSATLLKRSARMREFLYHIGVSDEIVPPPVPKEAIDFEWDLLEKIINSMNNISKKSNCEFIIFEVISGNNRLGRQSQLKEISDKLKIPLIETHDIFMNQLRANQILYWKDETHWTKNGHKLAAQTIFSYLKKRRMIKTVSIH